MWTNFGKVRKGGWSTGRKTCCVRHCWSTFCKTIHCWLWLISHCGEFCQKQRLDKIISAMGIAEYPVCQIAVNKLILDKCVRARDCTSIDVGCWWECTIVEEGGRRGGRWRWKEDWPPSNTLLAGRGTWSKSTLHHVINRDIPTPSPPLFICSTAPTCHPPTMTRYLWSLGP